MKIMRLFRPDGAYRNAFCSILTAGLLSACGSGIGELVAIAIVTPLGGVWTGTGGTDGQISFSPQDEVFASKVNLTANVSTTSVVADCGGNLEGTLDNGKLVLHPLGVTTTCLEGGFTDMVTLELMAGPDKLVYLNDRVAVSMSDGLWVSDGIGQLKLKFETPDSVDNDSSPNVDNVAGCDVSAGIRFTGKMNGFNTATDSRPSIPELRSKATSALMFTQIVFEHGASLKLFNSAGQAVTLHRTPDTTTTCP